MTINHAALWVSDLEGMKLFYERCFGAMAGQRYENPKKGFSSYFLSFSSGARLELMHKEGMMRPESDDPRGERAGMSHLAFSTGSEAEVDRLTGDFSERGIKILSRPRRTGDGYYESVIADPEGNTIEITV